MKQSDLNDGIFFSLCFDLRSLHSESLFYSDVFYVIVSLKS